jgi:hypothetical protein
VTPERKDLTIVSIYICEDESNKIETLTSNELLFQRLDFCDKPKEIETLIQKNGFGREISDGGDQNRHLIIL